MKNKIKKIVTTSLLSAVALSAIGCSTTNNKLAKNIDKSMAEFVASINKLDYVETGTNETNKIGKIVETSNNTDYLNENISTLELDKAITKPSERSDNFKLFVLSNRPYISLTSEDNSASLDINLRFSTDIIEQTSDEINDNINTLILKRSILMIYVNEIYNGNITLTEENKVAINAYVNVIKENASFLNGNRGMVRNQLGIASDLVESNKNNELINYYIIKSGEALETRSNKINSTISAIDSIINILEANLSPNSPYYNSKLSSTYQNIISNTGSNVNQNNTDNPNIEIANNIAESLRFKTELKQNANTNVNTNQNTLNQTNVKNKTNNLVSTEQNTKLNKNTSVNNEVNNLNLQNNTQSDYLARRNHVNQNNSNLAINNETTNNDGINNRTIHDTARRHNRIRRRNRTNNQNNETTQNPEVKTMEENHINQTNNHSRLKTTEEYNNSINSSGTYNNNSRATRVPYQTTSTYSEQ